MQNAPTHTLASSSQQVAGVERECGISRPRALQQLWMRILRGTEGQNKTTKFTNLIEWSRDATAGQLANNCALTPASTLTLALTPSCFWLRGSPKHNGSMKQSHTVAPRESVTRFWLPVGARRICSLLDGCHSTRLLGRESISSCGGAQVSKVGAVEGLKKNKC